MAGHRLPITPTQWSRFIENITPTLGELLVAGLLNAVVDDVELVGGNSKDDLRCRTGDLGFTVEVKTGWWHDEAETVVGHSPLRPTQHPDLVALVGTFDVSESAPTLRGLNERALTVESDRLLYLIPESVVRQHSRADGQSTARALILADVIRDYAVDLERGVSKRRILSLLEG